MGRLIEDMENANLWRLYCRKDELMRATYNSTGTVFVNELSGEKRRSTIEYPIVLASADGYVTTVSVPHLYEFYVREDFKPLNQYFVDKLIDGEELVVRPDRSKLIKMFHAEVSVYGLNCPCGINNNIRAIGDGDYVFKKRGKYKVLNSYYVNRFYENVEGNS